VTISPLMPSRGEMLAVLASAGLFVVAFPPFALVGPAFVCLVPLSIAIARAVDRGEPVLNGLRLGLWFGVFAYGAAVYWIAFALLIYTKLAILGYLGALAVLAAVLAATGAGLFAVRRATRLPMAVVLPIIWVASEMALNHLSDLAFPWLPLGLAVAGTPVMAQIADVSGVHGVSFWIALTNGLVADMWLDRANRRAVWARGAVIIAMVCGVVAYGMWRLRTVVLRPLAPIAVVQPNVQQEDKWLAANRGRIVGMLSAGTREILAKSTPKLVVWPEVALPDYLSQHRAWTDTLRTLTALANAPLLLGMLDLEYRSDADYDYYNAAELVNRDGTVTQPIYHKGKLVPIVERVPFVNPRWFSGFGQYFGSFGRGGAPVVFDAGFGKFGVLICYESIFPEVSRAYRQRGADFLVNVTNDAWFGHSLAPHQHFAHLALRAIENRTAVVRSANTGISGWIDPLGRVRAATPIFEAEANMYNVETSDTRTPYDGLGDFVGLLSSAAAAALIALDWTRQRRASVSAP
jgi:apolipoprotein N-acyltransferase